MQILVVDNEERIREVIREYAEFNGYTVEEASDGMLAVKMVREFPDKYSIILMDVMMPKMDGFTAVKEIRKISKTPVIMLTAKGEEYDKLFGFEVGVDDYVVKPFSPNELMARIRAVVSRSGGAPLKMGMMTFDEKGRVVTVKGERVNLTPKEFDLLACLIRNANIVLTRNQVLDQVWGADFYGDDRTVDSHIKMLRQSLGEARDYIVTIRSVGYKFEVTE